MSISSEDQCPDLVTAMEKNQLNNDEWIRGNAWIETGQQVLEVI